MRSGLRFPIPGRPLLPVLTLAWMLCAPAALAHKVTAVSSVATLDTQARTYRVELSMGVEPTEEAAQQDQIPPEQAARDFAEEIIQVCFDREVSTPRIEIHTVQPDKEAPIELQRLKVITTLTGSIPEKAEHFMLRLAESTEISMVLLVTQDGRESERLEVLLPGEYSRPRNLRPVIEGSPFEEGAPAKKTPASPPVTGDLTGKKGVGSFFLRGLVVPWTAGWLSLGFGLCFLLAQASGRALAWQAAMFFIGASLTFALTAYLPPSPGPVEAARYGVAAGLLWLAVEVLFHPAMTTWRLPLVFGFSLFHGVMLGEGFRSVPFLTPHPVGSLLAYHLGAMLSFLAFIAVCFFALAPIGRQSWFRARFATPLCLLLAGCAIYRLAMGE